MLRTSGSRGNFRWDRQPHDGTTARWHGSHVLVSIAAVAVGLAVSVTGWTGAWLWADRLAELELRERADNYARLLQYGINEDLKAMAGLRALFQSSDFGVTRREFAEFTGLVLRNQTAVENLAWVPRVGRAERGAIERGAVRDGIGLSDQIPDPHRFDSF